ncbi:MAG: hypothetical protein V3S37_03105 [Dehalococcoidia bacterium]
MAQFSQADRKTLKQAIAAALRRTETGVDGRRAGAAAGKVLETLEGLKGADFEKVVGMRRDAFRRALRTREGRGTVNLVSKLSSRLFRQGEGATAAAATAGTKVAVEAGVGGAVDIPVRQEGGKLAGLARGLRKDPLKLLKGKTGMVTIPLLFEGLLKGWKASGFLEPEYRAKSAALEEASAQVTPEAYLKELETQELVSQGKARLMRKDPLAFEILTRMLSGEGGGPKLTANEQFIYSEPDLDPSVRSAAEQQLTQVLMR